MALWERMCGHGASTLRVEVGDAGPVHWCVCVCVEVWAWRCGRDRSGAGPWAVKKEEAPAASPHTSGTLQQVMVIPHSQVLIPFLLHAMALKCYSVSAVRVWLLHQTRYYGRLILEKIQIR